MDPPRLTVTTIRYLYATTWLPCDEREKTVAVPGGQTTALDTAGNLLHTALWNLRRQGVFDFEQLRPVEVEQVVVLGGRSFSSFEFRDPGQDLRGLEGALIMAARDVASGGGFADRQIDRVTGEDGHGVRRLVTAMPLHNMGDGRRLLLRRGRGCRPRRAQGLGDQASRDHGPAGDRIAASAQRRAPRYTRGRHGARARAPQRGPRGLPRRDQERVRHPRLARRRTSAERRGWDSNPRGT
jgi:hypothetical protein